MPTVFDISPDEFDDADLEIIPADPKPQDSGDEGFLTNLAGEATESMDAEGGGFLTLLKAASDSLKGFTREALNTATFGFSDVVAGAGAALAEELFGGDDGDPARAFNRPREERVEFREESPISSGVASFAGGFLNPVGGPAASFVKNTAGLTGATIKSGLVGAGFAGGQVSGEFVGESIGRLAEGKEIDLAAGAGRIGTGTALGATIGSVLPPGIKLAGFGGKLVVDFFRRFSKTGQATRALRKVAEALERDGFTAEQALERINRLGPDAALIDAGENSRALAFAVAGIPGKGKTQVTKFLRDRQEGVRNPKTGVIEGGQVNRIQDHIDDLVKANFFTETQRLANINNAAKFYKNAYASNQQIESRVIDRILKTPSGRRAFQLARKRMQDLMKNLSKTDPELAQQLIESGGKATGKGVGRGLKLEFLDQVKKELFDLETLARDKFGKATQGSGAISKLRRALTKELDDVDITGDYARARLTAGDKLANQEALEKGANFLSKTEFQNPEAMAASLAEMSPEARHLFRVGAAQALKGKLAEVVTRADATKKAIDIQSLEQKIRLAFGDNKRFKSYVDLLENEKELFRAVTEALGNSKTAARGEALADISKDTGKIAQGVRDFLDGNFARGIVNLLGGAKDRVSFTPRETDVIGEILTGRNITGLGKFTPRVVSPLTEAGRPADLGQALVKALSITAGSRTDSE